MENATSLLLDLPGLSVVEVVLEADGGRVVHVVTADESASACPSCGVFSTSPKERRCTRPRDIPYGDRPVRLVWRKRRWRCREPLCARATFTESLPQVPARARVTTRCRRIVAARVGDLALSVAEVGAEYGLSWPTVHKAVVDYAEEVLVEPAPVVVLGIDETRRGRPRWEQDPDTGKWRLVDRWQTGFVDLDGGQGLLGQCLGRKASDVSAWLEDRSLAFRAAVTQVAIDPAAAYAAAVRTTLPAAVLVVDHFHLVQLANTMLTDVRRRVTQQSRGRRGRAKDGEWVNRRRLLSAHERLRPESFVKMWNSCLDADPSGQILTAWIIKEELRKLLQLHAAGHGHDRSLIGHRLWRFYSWCADSQLPEAHRLAATIETWWPAVEAFLATGISNARTEATNRLAKEVSRRACGFRNPTNHQRRVRLHCTRHTRRAPANVRP